MQELLVMSPRMCYHDMNPNVDMHLSVSSFVDDEALTSVCDALMSALMYFCTLSEIPLLQLSLPMGACNSLNDT